MCLSKQFRIRDLQSVQEKLCVFFQGIFFILLPLLQRYVGEGWVAVDNQNTIFPEHHVFDIQL